MFAAFNDLQRVEVTLYTDALITHGSVRTRQHRVTDILNLAEDPFLILEDVTVEEFGGKGEPISADFAQINLDSVLFAVANDAGGAGARAAHAEGQGGGDHVGPAVPGHGHDAPPAERGGTCARRSRSSRAGSSRSPTRPSGPTTSASRASRSCSSP